MWRQPTEFVQLLKSERPFLVQFCTSDIPLHGDAAQWRALGDLRVVRVDVSRHSVLAAQYVHPAESLPALKLFLRGPADAIAQPHSFPESSASTADVVPALQAWVQSKLQGAASGGDIEESTPPIHRSVDIFSITAQATASAGAPTVVEGEELPGRNKQRAEAWCVSQRQKCQSPVPSHAHQRVLPCVSLAGGCFRKWMPEGTATVYSMSMSC